MRKSSVSAASHLAFGAVVAAILSAPLAAQQANPSAEALGLDLNFVAKGMGVDAVAWNPAMLGMPRNPVISMNVGSFAGGAGLEPVSYNDFVKFMQNNANVIPDSVRHRWLNSVTANGGETGHQEASLSILALGIGHLAFQVSSNEAFSTTLNPDAFEAIMFGNAGSTGTARTLSFAGSSANAGVFTTGALSYGMSVPGSSGHQTVGVTAKYVLGNFLMMGQDVGSNISSDSVALNFPIVHTNTDSASNFAKAGSGFGLDLGYAWHTQRLTVSGVLQNVTNSFSWDKTKLVARPGTASFNGTTNSTSFDTTSFANAPQVLKDRVAEYTFKPALLAGVAYELNRKTTITGDFHQQMGDDNSILIGPKTQIGGGIEFRGIPFIPLRAGASLVSGGWSAAGGLGLALGPFELGLAGTIGHRQGGAENSIMISAFTIR